MKKIHTPREKITTSNSRLSSLSLLGINIQSVERLLDDLPVYLWLHDENQNIFFGNPGFLKSFGNCFMKKCHQTLKNRDRPCSCCRSFTALENNCTERCEICRRSNGGFDISVTHTPLKNQYGKKFILKSSFFQKENISRTNENSLLAEPQQTRHILVLCSGCGMAKTRENKWVTIDKQTIDCFNVAVSHGLCQDCVEKLYPSLAARINSAFQEHADD